MREPIIAFSTSRADGTGETIIKTFDTPLDLYLEDICLECRLPLRRSPDETLHDFGQRVAACLKDWNRVFAHYIGELNAVLNLNKENVHD
jgi:hypothetical protein